MKTRKGLFLLLAALPMLSACSINKMVMNKVSDALTGSGSSDVFTGDADPQLVGDAIPFAIKMYESLLSQNPNHQGLLLTTGSLFVMYANAFVQGPADMMGLDQFDQREAAKVRAKNLYIRGTEILYRGLDNKYPGDKKTPKFSEATVEAGTLDPILKKMKKDDVAFLYWAVAGGLSSYAIDVFDFALGVRIPEMAAMIARAYELDPDFNNGALDEFYILFYSSLPEMLGGNKELAEVHYKKALEKTKGQSAGTYVSYAQSVCVPAQDYETFKINLEKALAVDVDADPSNRLVNIINQRKARYMLDEAYNYFSFLEYDDWDE
ncbi:putative lipoprotein [Leadbettera azotonutricia ZAS-9]|uniref:Putative lipoprotein n=2 Tax=Leadbettera azotonutricia TaxID=150829 RepID=F5Y8U5_LEAAZ|nr:putative lipoprotein [Leadbettera azotonutricia ZAS-9]